MPDAYAAPDSATGLDDELRSGDAYRDAGAEAVDDGDDDYNDDGNDDDDDIDDEGRRRAAKRRATSSSLSPAPAAPHPPPPHQHNDPSLFSQWQRMIENAISAIVSIRFSQVSAFDTEGPETSEASGFVVDKSAGFILTNRHVACAGPFVGEAIFHDHEEVDVFPVYRDPIHDFGVLKFDPSKIKFQPVTAVPLAPHLAKVGLEIRVVG
ncbi:hypothetical protein HK405_015739 [Cladochytrium tenue]|nr:hypothetical protein HK405_015739 [Cladochytrium tenue]